MRPRVPISRGRLRQRRTTADRIAFCIAYDIANGVITSARCYGAIEFLAPNGRVDPAKSPSRGCGIHSAASGSAGSQSRWLPPHLPRDSYRRSGRRPWRWARIWQGVDSSERQSYKGHVVSAQPRWCRLRLRVGTPARARSATARPSPSLKARTWCCCPT